MSLSSYAIRTSVAVSDIAAAREFYEGALSLAPAESITDLVRIYPCGDGTALHVYESPAHAGKTTGTVAAWTVDDLEQTVDALTVSGVTFAQYEDPVTDAKGIHTYGDHQVAWFADPDGNTFAIDNGLPY